MHSTVTKACKVNRCNFLRLIFETTRSVSLRSTRLRPSLCKQSGQLVITYVAEACTQQPPRAVLFVESAVHRVSRDKVGRESLQCNILCCTLEAEALLGAGPHCCIVAYPIESHPYSAAFFHRAAAAFGALRMGLLVQARTYWKKAKLTS